MSNIISKTRDFLLTEGIFLIVVGLFMIFMSQASTFFISFLLSIGLFFVGLYRIINSIVTRKNIPAPFLSIMSGIMLAIIGLYLIFHPLFNTLVLTVAAALYFVIESINSFSSAISSKGFKQIFWVGLFSGIVQLILAVIILLGLPFTALWILGLLIGVNFVFSGVTCISGYFYSKDYYLT